MSKTIVEHVSTYLEHNGIVLVVEHSTRIRGVYFANKNCYPKRIPILSNFCYYFIGLHLGALFAK